MDHTLFLKLIFTDVTPTNTTIQINRTYEYDVVLLKKLINNVERKNTLDSIGINLTKSPQISYTFTQTTTLD